MVSTLHTLVSGLLANSSRRLERRTVVAAGLAVTPVLTAFQAGGARRKKRKKKKCKVGTTRCNTCCVSTISDNANCGDCGIACQTFDACLNGGCGRTCVNPSPPGNCSGATCTGVQADGNCDTTTEGEVVCINLGPPCGELEVCDDTSDCSAGHVCTLSGCCDSVGKPKICTRLV